MLKRSVSRLVLSFMVLIVAAGLQASTALIRLESFPTMSVADGRSTVTITATIRDKGSNLVPDGTQVVFTTTAGSFRNPVVTTTNGIAQAILVAGQLPGTAKITATALAYNTINTLDYEFVADRSLLSSAKEYVEVTAPEYLMYSMDLKTIGAAGPGQEVTLRYREVEITADDLQYTVTSGIVKARKAKLKIGKFEKEFDELYFVLSSRKGFGTTTYTAKVIEVTQNQGILAPYEVEKLIYGVAQITSQGVAKPTDNYGANMFEFEDLSESTSGVAAKKATVFPRKNIQFHRADIYIGTTKIANLPLYQVPVYGNTPLVTDQIVNVNDNQLAVNYPHYLQLKPGLTSLLRFRTGERYGRTSASNQGAFIDYELNWNKGDDMDGGLVLSGLTRNDWSLGFRQYARLDDRTTANAMVEFPAHSSFFGSANIARQLNGFSLNLNANHSRSLRGSPFQNESYMFALDSDPIKFGKSPFRLTYGLTASEFKSSYESTSTKQSAMGIRTKLQMLPQALDSQTMFNASLAVSKQVGTNTPDGLGYGLDLSMSRRLGNNSSVLLGYSLIDDGFSSIITGKHNLSLTAYSSIGRTYVSLSGAKSLDVDRLNAFVDASYRVSGLWRLSYAYTLNRYIADSYSEYLVGLNYRMGWREIGLTWSSRTKRLGIQVLGAQIN